MIMWLQEVYQRLVNRPRTRRQAWPQTGRRSGIRLGLEQLEDRLVPSNFAAATVSDLIADINAASQQGGTNTITLVAPSTSPYVLTAVNNTTDGATGLPVIAANDNLTILGNGATIERSTVSGTPAFRLLDVAAGGSLTLANLTLQGGFAYGSGVAAKGAAIYNHGTVDLNGVTVENNIAQGELNEWGAGGGVYSSGALTLEGGTNVQNNQALGGAGGVGIGRHGLAGLPGKGGVGGGICVDAGSVTLSNVTLSFNNAQGGAGGGGAAVSSGGSGGPGQGGALFVINAAVTMSNLTVSANTAVGGNGGNATVNGGMGGNGLGGGVYVAYAAGGGTVTLRTDSLTSNSARAGTGGTGLRGYAGAGVAEGGALCIEPSAVVYLDASTLKNAKHNTPDNIYGPYQEV
jgi:hypothetical protein